VPAVLSVGESWIAQLLLELDNLLDVLLLDGLEVGLCSLSLLEGGLDFEKLIGTEERAEMLNAERGVAVERHGNYSGVLI
jgi:hypothetical protein